MRWTLLFLALSAIPCVAGSDDTKPARHTFDYEVARTHEIEPHRRTIPLKGVRSGFNQLRLSLVVSTTGDVIEAEAGGDDDALKFWPKLQDEVRAWKFVPFEVKGKAVSAEVEEYIDLVPPERLPQKHVVPPLIRPNSNIAIALQRTGCFGTCPSYTVVVSTGGITFEGGGFTVASGKHRESVDPDAVRELAKKFEAADFYSMETSYQASVTDNPTYVLSIDVDGRKMQVVDYVGAWEGMPSVISELEKAVDKFARTERWIEGRDGLVSMLRSENYEFRTFQAQVMLKEAASRGNAATVRDLLIAGVPLESMPTPKSKEQDTRVPFENVGWLTAASAHADVLKVLIERGASKYDQNDKDLALAGAARSGSLEAARALIAYGANPKADLSKLTVSESSGGMTMESRGAGSVLIYAAESGNPEMVREILRYKPKIETRDRQGRTALFVAAQDRNGDVDGARVECVRLLAQAGADVNARDEDGNTALHETYLTDVEQELLKLGADVNARNNEGETPIFTTVDDDAIPLFVRYGADLNTPNNDGQTVFEAAKDKGPARQEALRKALENRITTPH